MVCTTGRGPTGSGSELEEKIRITPRKGQLKKTVMSLGPGEDRFASIPDLEPGDLLEVTAEIGVTTDSSAPYYRKRYDFDPMVCASLLLASTKAATEPDRRRALALCSPWEGQCTREAHHGVIVFRKASLQIPDEGLPWRGDSFVNLVMDAHHPHAAGNQVLLIGEHEHVGGRIEVKGGKGRLNAVRFRPATKPRSKTARTETLLAEAVPVDKSMRTVVYSVPLDDLAKGDQLSFEARMTTRHPAYPARVSTRVLLADDQAQTDVGGNAKALTDFKGEVGEHNGFNGSGGRFRTRRVGVLRIRKPASRAHVNLVADSGDPFGRGDAGDVLRLVDDGYLRVKRYDATLSG